MNIDENPSFDWLGLGLVVALLFTFLIAFCQPFGYSPDYFQYDFFFEKVRYDFGYMLSSSRFEPGFIILSGILAKAFQSNIFVYSIFAAIAISIKLWVSKKYSLGFFLLLGLTYYFFRFFPLHELTQLRAGLAASLALLSFYYSDKNKLCSAALILCAMLFHYSAIIVFPFFFVPIYERERLLVFFGLYAALLLFFSAVLLKFFSGFFQVFQMYEQAGVSSSDLKFLSPVFWPEYFMIVFSLAFWSELSSTMRRIVVLQVAGFAFLYGFSSLDVVAIRGREFFSVFWFIFILDSGRSDPRVRVGVLVFLISSVALSTYQYFYLDFFSNLYYSIE